MDSATRKLQRRLLNSAKRQVSKAGLAFSAGCDHMAVKLISTGVQRMTFNRLVEKEDKIRLAEDNLRRLVRRLGEVATRNGTFPIVDEKSFTEAVKDVSPLWPYC